MTFSELCQAVEREMESDFLGGEPVSSDPVTLQKRAIIGYKAETDIMKRRIEQILESFRVSEVVGDSDIPKIPSWYENAVEAVFHEIWGLAGIAEWFGAEYAQSSSAKIIGERIYFMKDGVMTLMPQTISGERSAQLIRALLLLSPEERLDSETHEIYMLDGTRVTVFRGGMVKKNQQAVIFRRYVIPIYSFEEQTARGTIPEDAVPLFEDMVRIGYNVVFCGSVRSAKTTFLATWQSYEDPTLEGVLVETDPEIPMHTLMPDAPVVQIIADGDKLAGISKSLMRSDADYFILAEARDGIALDTAVRIARKGTRRMKMTYHCHDPLAFSQDAAAEIVRSLGGNTAEIALRIADSFDYVFHFANIRPGNRKRLRGIYELDVEEDLSADSRRIAMHEVCRYLPSEDDWRWMYHLGDEKREAGYEADAEALMSFDQRLRALSERSLS
ncbi:MAG: hypothetical protein LBN36_04895 [Clostridiales Family XIII bacterium]|jgi:pilus assembly protein CpaF|nr:hypothetical protein [Clostridiales Family XIII bacterium]